MDEAKVQELISEAIATLEEKITTLETQVAEITTALEEADIEAEITAEETE